jgi:hypothetical protein
MDSRLRGNDTRHPAKNSADLREVETWSCDLDNGLIEKANRGWRDLYPEVLR